MNRVQLLGIPIDKVTMDEAASIVESYIKERNKLHLIATANAEMVMLAQKDDELKYILNHADMVVPDGAGVVWAASYQGTPVSERVAGYDLAQNILSRAAKKGYRVFMFGGAPNVAEKAKQTAEKWYPGINVVGIRNGFFTSGEVSNIIEDINSSKADILLVAIGVPKQEKWLYKHLKDLDVPVAIGVGGTLDVMAGIVKRAPLWMQKAKLEWFFRLVMQPSRFMRMLALPQFVIKVVLNDRVKKC